MMIQKKTTLKIICVSIIVLAAVFIFLWIIPFSYDINTTVKAMMICGANTDETEVEITIKGLYTKYFFRDDKFSGNFIVEGFAVTENPLHTVDINIGKKGNAVPGGLWYSWQSNHFGTIVPDGRFFSLFYVEKKFKSFLIVPGDEYIADPSYEGNEGSVTMDSETITVICYPAKTRDDAVKMANSTFKSYSKDTGSDFNIK